MTIQLQSWHKNNGKIYCEEQVFVHNKEWPLNDVVLFFQMPVYTLKLTYRYINVTTNDVNWIQV